MVEEWGENKEKEEEENLCFKWSALLRITVAVIKEEQQQMKS